MKDARRDFKQTLGKVEDVKEVELFMQITAFLLFKEILTLTQKVTEYQGVFRGLYTSHVVLCFLKDDEHRDYLV